MAGDLDDLTAILGLLGVRLEEPQLRALAPVWRESRARSERIGALRDASIVPAHVRSFGPP